MAGSTHYNLDFGTAETGTLNNIGIVALPSPYVEAYVNFCDPAEECGEDVYLCITGPGASKPFPLCNSRPTGDFLVPASPQLGAWFSCVSTAGNITNGIVSSVAYGSRTEDGEHSSEPAAHPVCVCVSLCVCVCVRCGPQVNTILGLGFDALYTNASLTGNPMFPATYDFAIPTEIYCDNSGTPGVPI
jgi:hypothetical protein